VADVAPDTLAAAVTRVTAYLDALDEVAARRARSGMHEGRGDDIHVFNGHDLRRSDLRALLAAIPAERERIAAAIEKAARPYLGSPYANPVLDAYADAARIAREEPLPTLRWVGCDRYTSSTHDVIAYVHLVRDGDITTLCNATASSPDVWERRRYRHRPKCQKCLDALGRTAEEVGRG
jgi:hypothetical protein